MFKGATQTTLRDIPYKGSAPALAAVLSGEVHATFDGITNYLPYARRGKLKILAVFSDNAGTPTAIVNRLNQVINASLQAPELRDRLRADATSGPILSPEGYGDFMRKQAQIWEKVITPLKLEMTQ